MTKSTKFNVARYQELLNKINSSTKNGIEYFQDPEVLELLACKSSVSNQISYDQKNEYFDLIQKYLDETISPYEFRTAFLGMSNKNREKSNKIFDNLEKLGMLSIEPGLKEFGSLLSKIYELCLTIVEFGIGDEGISEDRFRNLIQKIFIEMKERYL